MGHQVPAGQLQQLLAAFINKRQQAVSQAISNTLWAVATMGQQLQTSQLQQLLERLLQELQQASAQDVANTLWTCAALQYVPQQLLTASVLVDLLQSGKPQELANSAWACGQLGHRGEQLIGALLAEVQQRLASEAGRGNSTTVNCQDLCNLCWAVALLDMQQYAQQVQQLAWACSSMWSSAQGENKRQLWQVHTWLLDFQLAGGQGLQGSLTEQQLQQCRAACQQQTKDIARSGTGDFQKSVFAAVRQLGLKWQQQPQMEQLSSGLDRVTIDGALIIDIAGRAADGVLVAVEADGPWHFRLPDGGLMGSSQYRNRALAVRGYRVASVPWFEWAELKGAEQQQQYLLRLCQAAGVA